MYWMVAANKMQGFEMTKLTYFYRRDTTTNMKMI